MGTVANKGRLVIAIAACLALSPSFASACGFWGDGDVGQITNDHDVDTKGRLLSALSPVAAQAIAYAKIPGTSGYGYVVFGIDNIQPYAKVFGRDKPRAISFLATQGYAAAIDLMPSSKPAHRDETVTAGLTYFPLPIAGNLPTTKQVLNFNNFVENETNLPALIYAPEVESMAMLWAAHNAQRDKDINNAIQAAKSLGLSYAGEMELHWQMKNGKLKTLME